MQTVPISRMERFKALLGGEHNMPKPRDKPVQTTASPGLVESPRPDLVDAEHVSITGLADLQHVGPVDLQPSMSVVVPDGHEQVKHDMNTSKYATAKELEPTLESLTLDAPSVPQTVSEFKLDEKIGEPSPIDMRFCPVSALSKLPYKFLTNLPKPATMDVAHRFFDQGKFWTRTWNLYHVYSSLFPTERPIVFVSEEQARQFIQEVSAAFPNFKITFPDSTTFEGFVVEFPADPPLRPSWLGVSFSREQHDFMQANAPFVNVSRQIDTNEVESFKTLMDLAVNVAKNKRNTAKKQEERHQLTAQQFTMAKRQLGLCHPENDVVPSPLSINGAIPYAPHQDVVFIACDVESFERNQNLITEIGIATLDARDLATLAPGPRGLAWLSKVRSRHFRIEEYTHLENRDFVRGCANAFDFGESEFVSIHAAPRMIASCFKSPFSMTDNHIDYDDPCNDDVEVKRNIVLVGHDTGTDIAYLRKLGYDVTNIKNLVGVLDTAALYRAHTRTTEQPALARILYDMDLAAWNLHNAGNDAVYTMHALIATCVSDAQGLRKGLP